MLSAVGGHRMAVCVHKPQLVPGNPLSYRDQCNLVRAYGCRGQGRVTWALSRLPLSEIRISFQGVLTTKIMAVSLMRTMNVDRNGTTPV